MNSLPVTRVVLYKHGVGYFERTGSVTGDATCSLTFKQAEVSDVLKSLTVLDLDGGHVASVSYDSTKPLEQLLDEVAIHIPDENSLVGLLPQIKGARVALRPTGGERTEGTLLGVDASKRQTDDGIVETMRVSLLTDEGGIVQFDLHDLSGLEILDPALRRDLDFYLKTQLSAKKKDSRTFTFFAKGDGERRVRLSYTLEAPVWKATYRLLLGEEGKPPLIQGWAVVDNTQDDDWDNVTLSLVAGLPVSFVHDLYTPRYIRRPVVAVKETTGVLPPEVEGGMDLMMMADAMPAAAMPMDAELAYASGEVRRAAKPQAKMRQRTESAVSSAPAQVRERKLGDLFEYEIEHPVSIRRNQSALVPIVLRPFEGRSVLLHNRNTRPENPMRAVEFKNSTGLTLEGGPVTVSEAGSYVGEAMLDTLKPDEQRLIPYAVELSVRVLDNVSSWGEKVRRVTIVNGILNEYHAQRQRITYHIDNRGDTAQTIYVDHPRPAGEWKLVESASPTETTENYWRFRFDLPAKKVTEFAVTAETVLHQGRHLAHLDAKTLALWLEGNHLDAATTKALRELIDLHRQVAEQESTLARLNDERNRIVQEQSRIRENLGSLADRASEKELRERFVKTLTRQEDRLEQIEKEVRTTTQTRDHTREAIGRVVAAVGYEG